MARGWSVEWKGDNFKRFLENPEKEFLMKCGYYVEGESKKILTEKVYNQPQRGSYKRTGALRSDIHTVWHPLERAVYVGNNIHYAPYIEFGTRKMKARPYLRPAFDKFRAKVGLI